MLQAFMAYIADLLFGGCRLRRQVVVVRRLPRNYLR